MKFRMLYLDLTWQCNNVELPCMTTSSKRPPPISKSIIRIFPVKALKLEPLINDHLSYNVSNRGPFLGSSILVLEFSFVINLFYEQPPDTMVWSLCLCMSVILLQIVMVSPGTRLVKNHESQSGTIESQFVKQWFPGSFVTTQLIWRQTSKLRIVWFQNNYIHTLPREDSFICTPDLPGFSISGFLWWLWKFKICNLTYQNRYSASSCFLGVFRNCIINKRINVCIWQIVKLWVSQSYWVMTLVCWIYTTAITQQYWHQGGCFITTQYHVTQISQSENWNSYSVWKLNNKAN